MSQPLNIDVIGVGPPPIASVHAWIDGRDFPEERPLLDVSQAVPSYPPADELIEHLAEKLREPRTSIYTSILGLAELRASLAGHLSDDYAATIDPENVAITSGCNQAFCVAMDVLARAGDEVILPAPYYFNHQMWLEMRGVRPVHVLSDETGCPTPGSIADAITDRTRAIALVSPNNPTGAEYSSDLVMALYELAKSKGIALVMDETYKDFRTGEQPPHAVFHLAGWQETFVQLYSFSKAYSLTGYRVGAMIAGPAVLEQAIKVLDCASICPSHVGQHAALFALARLQPWKEGKAAMMRERVATLRRSFLDNRLRYRLVSSGAYFAYIKHPFEHRTATAVARRLADELNVLCLPGDMFGPSQDAFLRFAFANLEAAQIPPLVARLVESQDRGWAG